MTLLRIILIAGMTAWGLPSASAAPLEFSAEQSVNHHGETHNAQINFKGDRWRMEFAVPVGRAMAAIYRADLNLVWWIHSRERQYLELPFLPEHVLPITEALDGEIGREFIGTESLHGHSCELFEVTVRRGDQQTHYYQWVTTKERFPIKMIQKNGNYSVEYRRLKFAPQPIRYFEPPLSYIIAKRSQPGS
jgi:hypothetical protein